MDQISLKSLGQKLTDLMYPPQCLACTEPTETASALCATCWSDASFIAGPVCDTCGQPVLNALSRTQKLICDDCMRTPPAWERGRAAMLYDGAGKRMILGLKHGDRQDLVLPLSKWMCRSGIPLLSRAELIVPVPLHWLRLAKRQFNQAATLAKAISRETGVPMCPDALTRARATESQGKMDRTARHENLAGAFCETKARRGRMDGKHVLLIDDVMTSGATLSACAEVCRASGARGVDTLVAARVRKSD